MAFFSGPRVYMKKLFVQKNLYASVFMLSSIVLALWFSVFSKSYILSIVFCLCELNAVLWYYCNTSAVSRESLKSVGQLAGAYVKSKF